MLIDQLIKSIEVQTFLLQRHITLWSLTVAYSQVCYEPINDQLPVGFLAQLVRALHWCRRGQSSNLHKPEFFQAFFSHLDKLSI